VLDAGAPVLTVQVLLGHKRADTTLGYARLHDGAVVAGFCRPIGEIVSRV
jgi:site-specific recombinase XerD